ncbi:MAG TPA: hypothetical protein VFT13_06335 [Candidatus Krumholzibacteria bacterium]|nr:hypothetical protein [Candidatus Krumholzibacteria bacterium]
MKRSHDAMHLVPTPAGRRLAAAAFFTLALLGVALDAIAQSSIQVRGLVDIVATDVRDDRYLNTVNTNDSNFDALRSRLFVEGQRGQTSVYLQFLVSPESYDEFRFFGGYLMHRVFEDRNVFLEAGLIPLHDGIWASHTYSNKNPLVGIPMAQYWKTTMHAFMIPTDLDQLLSMRGRGQTGFVYADSNGVRGQKYSSAPIVYDNCWNYGAFSLGTLGRFEYALGVTLGAPAASVQGSDSNENLAWHAKVGYAFMPGLKLWLTGARGAYMDRVVAPYLPAGKTVNDYYQNLLIVSGDFQWWRLAMIGEVYFNHFDTPVREAGLSNDSYYLQAVYSIVAGWDLAVRYDRMMFEEVPAGSGELASWDENVERWEGGVGYHVTRDLFVKGVVQGTRGDGDWDVIPAVQASFSF